MKLTESYNEYEAHVFDPYRYIVKQNAASRSSLSGKMQLFAVHHVGLLAETI